MLPNRPPRPRQPQIAIPQQVPPQQLRHAASMAWVPYAPVGAPVDDPRSRQAQQGSERTQANDRATPARRDSGYQSNYPRRRGYSNDSQESGSGLLTAAPYTPHSMYSMPEGGVPRPFSLIEGSSVSASSYNSSASWLFPEPQMHRSMSQQSLRNRRLPPTPPHRPAHSDVGPDLTLQRSDSYSSMEGLPPVPVSCSAAYLYFLTSYATCAPP